MFYNWKFNSVSLLSVFILTAILVSCSQKEKFNENISENEVKVIHIPEDRIESTSFEDFIEDIKLIPLETTEESLIAEVEQVIISHNKFYVHDLSLNEVFVFDKKGKFLFKLDRRGKGPQEYTSIRDIKVDEKGDIHILDFKNVVIFDHSGAFVKKIAFSLPESYHINPVHFALGANNGYYLWSGSLGIKTLPENQYVAYRIDHEGTFTGDAYFPLKTTIMGGGPRFTSINNNNHYNMVPINGCDTIYRFTPKEVFPAYYIDFGKRKLPAGFMSEFSNGRRLHEAFQNTKYVTMIHHLSETPEYISFLHQSDKKMWATIFSKKTDNVKCFDRVATIQYFPVIIGGIDSKLVGNIEAFDLINGLKNGSLEKSYGFIPQFKELEKKVEELKENDNSVLMVLSINKDF